MVQCNIFQLKEIIYTILDNLIVFLIVVSQSLTVLLCKKREKKKKITNMVLIWKFMDSLGADCASKSWTVFFIIILHVFVLNFLICDELLLCAV